MSNIDFFTYYNTLIINIYKSYNFLLYIKIEVFIYPFRRYIVGVVLG